MNYGNCYDNIYRNKGKSLHMFNVEIIGKQYNNFDGYMHITDIMKNCNEILERFIIMILILLEIIINV